MLESEGRKPLIPVLNDSIPEFIMIPSAEPKCPPLEALRLLPMVRVVFFALGVQVVVSRICGESVLRGSNIFVKGIESMERTCVKGERVCIVVNTCNTQLPRGSDLELYDGKNM